MVEGDNKDSKVPGYLSSVEAGRYMDISWVMIHRLAASGQLPATYFPNVRGKRFRISDLDAAFRLDSPSTAVAPSEALTPPGDSTSEGEAQMYFSLADAVRYTGLAKMTIHRLATKGELPRLRLDGVEGSFYRRADLDALLADEPPPDHPADGTDASNPAPARPLGTAGRRPRRGRGRPPRSEQ